MRAVVVSGIIWVSPVWMPMTLCGRGDANGVRSRLTACKILTLRARPRRAACLVDGQRRVRREILPPP